MAKIRRKEKRRKMVNLKKTGRKWSLRGRVNPTKEKKESSWRMTTLLLNVKESPRIPLQSKSKPAKEGGRLSRELTESRVDPTIGKKNLTPTIGVEKLKVEEMGEVGKPKPDHVGLITDSWHIVNRVCNEIINYSVISVNCKKLIIECANAGIDSFEKEIRYEKIAIEKYSVEKKRSEKVLEMYEVSRELSRIERLWRVEKVEREQWKEKGRET